MNFSIGLTMSKWCQADPRPTIKYSSCLDLTKNNFARSKIQRYCKWCLYCCSLLWEKRTRLATMQDYFAKVNVLTENFAFGSSKLEQRKGQVNFLPRTRNPIVSQSALITFVGSYVITAAYKLTSQIFFCLGQKIQNLYNFCQILAC